jgi:hypothetical protein
MGLSSASEQHAEKDLFFQLLAGQMSQQAIYRTITTPAC